MLDSATSQQPQRGASLGWCIGWVPPTCHASPARDKMMLTIRTEGPPLCTPAVLCCAMTVLPCCHLVIPACSLRRRCGWRLEKMMRTRMQARRARKSPPLLPVRIESQNRTGCWQQPAGNMHGPVHTHCGVVFSPASCMGRHLPTCCCPAFPLRRHGVGGQGEGRPRSEGGRHAGEGHTHQSKL